MAPRPHHYLVVRLLVHQTGGVSNYSITNQADRKQKHSTLKWACSTTFQKDSAKQSSTPKSTLVRAVPERGNQGQTQHKGTAAGTAYAALEARRHSRRGLVSSARTVQHCVLRLFLLLHKIDGKPCFAFFFSKKPCSVLFFSPFPPKLGLQNLTGARIDRMLTVTLLSHSLWA